MSGFFRAALPYLLLALIVTAVGIAALGYFRIVQGWPREDLQPAEPLEFKSDIEEVLMDRGNGPWYLEKHRRDESRYDWRLNERTSVRAIHLPYPEFTIREAQAVRDALNALLVQRPESFSR